MATQNLVEVVSVQPPPPEQQVQRAARFAAEGEKKTRYCLPDMLESASPVGYRRRVAFSADEAALLMPLLSLERPAAFVPGEPVTEQEIFEECSLGILSARQSTNYEGHRQVTFGPADTRIVTALMRELRGFEAGAEVLGGASHTHVVLSRPYRTPFTLLLTFVGHKPVLSLGTVALRALNKRFRHVDDIPSVGFMQQVHVGILADAQERAAIIASGGRRRAQVFSAPFVGHNATINRDAIRRIEELVGLTRSDRAAGWRIALVTQVGSVKEELGIPAALTRKLGANLLAFRSERIQPGVNQEEKGPDGYQHRQDMDVPDKLTVMCGRAAYNAFVHWTGCERERSKDLLLLERIDVLTPGGKERLRELRRMLNGVTDRVIRGIPLWADLPTGRAFSRNAGRGKKAFALAGQRIYLGGLDRTEVEACGLEWDQALRAFGASAARSSLTAELLGCIDLPDNCDLLAGVCLMAGPVNQNDIGKTFFGHSDMLDKAFPDRNPTSLLMWTLKAKTIADPIGNEEQLMNARRKGALVDLRPGPHQVVSVRRDGRLVPMRKMTGIVNGERAFADVHNFVTDPDGRQIPGNRGANWPVAQRNEVLT